MGDDELCNTRLDLGLGFGGYVPKKIQKINKATVFSDLSFTLIPKEESAINVELQASDDPSRRSNESRESCLGKRDFCSNNYTMNGDRERKKLRLSKEQSSLLEESFKLHTTLNPAQKQALAQQLNLKTRQVEVWFQNRRARTKLKQTEVDCEFLKKCCERLSEENRRLKKEMQDFRSLKNGASQLYIQLPTAPAIVICPSCDKRAAAAAVPAAPAAAARPIAGASLEGNSEPQ